MGNLVKNMAQVNRQIWEINKSTNKNMGSIKDILGGLCNKLKTNLKGEDQKADLVINVKGNFTGRINTQFSNISI